VFVLPPHSASHECLRFGLQAPVAYVLTVNFVTRSVFFSNLHIWKGNAFGTSAVDLITYVMLQYSVPGALDDAFCI